MMVTSGVTSLCCITAVCFLSAAVSADESPALAASDKRQSTLDHLWAKAMQEEDDEQGEALELLQLKDTKVSGRRKKICPLPDVQKFSSTGKGCPHPGPILQEGTDIWGSSCLLGNRNFLTLADAWGVCGGTDSCSSVMQYDDGLFYLRRASDPDQTSMAGKLGELKLYTYECEEDAEVKAPQMTYTLIDRLIILPEYNLLFCYMEKVACTAFNDLFSQLRMRTDETVKRTEGAEGWLQHSLYSRDFPKEEIEAMMVNTSWHKALFYRDPIERFVSGYRSKCEGADGDGEYFCRQAFGAPVISFREAADTMFAKRGEPVSNSSVNEHFMRQTSFCGGLDNTIQYYDTVERLEEETAREKTLKLMDKIGAKKEWVQDFDKLFPSPKALRLENESFKDNAHATNTSDHIEEYFPEEHPEILAELYVYYQDDYRLFNMSPPKWQKEQMAKFLDNVDTSSKRD